MSGNEANHIGETVEDRETERPYRVIHLFDVDYMVDESHLVILQADRSPSLADMEAVARKFNELFAWRKMRDEILDAIKLLAHPKFNTDASGHIQYYVTKSDVAFARSLLPRIETIESAKRPTLDHGTNGQASSKGSKSESV